MKSFFKNAGRCCTVALAAATLLPLVARAQAPTPFGAVPNARQIEWYHRERENFLHFNMATFTNQEWADGTANPSTFNPTALDCGQWVRTLKQAGFPCALMVAKHQDGFCLWPTATTTYSIASSPYMGGKGDIVKQFTDSCRAYGLKPGIYLAGADLHFLNVLGNTVAAYQTYYMSQLLEICKNYGTIWEVWWDGANNGLPASAYQTFADTIHKLQPNCVIWSDAAGKAQTADSRWIGNEAGNAGDPCWSTIDAAWSNEGNGVLGGAIYCPAEVNSSDRPGWFWHQSENTSVNTVDVMWNKYFQSTGRNCVWLYNLPPDTRGLIYSTDSIRVDSVGCYIYGTFKTNLAEGATVTTKHPRGAGYEPANLVDTAEATYYATPDNVYTDTIVFDLGSAKTFDCLMLREVIQLGHRTTGWSVDYSSDNSTFTSLLTGKQSIGYKWLETFNAVTARYVRLKITKGQACVALNTFGVYKKTFLRSNHSVGTVSSRCPALCGGIAFAMRVFGRSVNCRSHSQAGLSRPSWSISRDARWRQCPSMQSSPRRAYGPPRPARDYT